MLSWAKGIARSRVKVGSHQICQTNIAPHRNGTQSSDLQSEPPPSQSGFAPLDWHPKPGECVQNLPLRCRISTAMVIPESFELQATSDVQIFREPPSRLRVPYQSDRGRSPSASWLRHDRPFHGAPQPSDEPWRRFHDTQLPCYARLVPCRCSFGIDISTLLSPLQVMNHASSHPLRQGSITPALPANFPAHA
jgi:hypothetical protein